jgi:2-isopropylmalate synthase
VEWSAEDATRTVPDFLCKCVEVAIHSGATVINVPDTVGYSTPQEFFDIITMLREPRAQCRQGDLLHPLPQRPGLGVANSLAGVLAGRAPGGMHHQRHRRARRQCRAGRDRDGAEGEEGHHALHHQHQHHLLNRASKLVSNVTGFPVQYNKAIVGKNAFSHESGIHQDGMLKNVETYEIMRPEDVGVNATSLMLGKLSGRHAFRDKLESMNYTWRRGLRGRLPALQGPGRQEKACLRRGHRRPGR